MTHKVTWYKKILKEKQREIILSTIIFTFTLTLWHFFTGKSFQWQSINPVETPDLLPRLFYSALVYVTLGAFLYSIGFYKFLYSLYRGTQGGWRAYNRMKGRIWLLLILGMYFVIVPVVVDILNATISFFYNVFNLVLYLFPALGISTIVFFSGYLILKKVLPQNMPTWLGHPRRE